MNGCPISFPFEHLLVALSNVELTFMLKCFEAFLHKLRLKKNSWYSNSKIITFVDHVTNLQTMSYVFISRKLTNPG